MMENCEKQIDIILKAELYHSLGADRMAQEEIKKLKTFENDDYIKRLTQGLLHFYQLENDKYRVKYSEGQPAPHCDRVIEKRLSIYEGTIKKLNQAGLNLFNTHLLCGQYDECKIEIQGKKATDLRNTVELVENYIIYICYRRIFQPIARIEKLACEKTDPKSLEEEIEAEDCIRDLRRFFGGKADAYLDTPDFRRDVRAKLMRFKGMDRYDYWRGLFDETNGEQRRLYYQCVNDPVKACFSGITGQDEFMGQFLCYLILKYHVLSHRISEGKQHSIFHRGKDDNGNAHYGDYSLISSYVSYKIELERCRKIFTFVRFISKYYPEFFRFSGGTPVADLFQALAYLRRGNTYFLQENYEKAFNDYNYAQNFLRHKGQWRKESTNRLMAVYDAVLEAICLSAKGECYRQDYDYDKAYDYFCQSVIMFEQLPEQFLKEDANIFDTYEDGDHIGKGRQGDLNWLSTRDEWKDMVDCGLRYNVCIIDKAKMFMVKGDFRRAIKWYCYCLRNFFRLYERIRYIETGVVKEISGHQELINALSQAITYLERTKNNAIVHKASITDYMQFLTERLDGFLALNGADMKAKCRLTGLMSDIYNRISILLYLLALPGKGHPKCHELSRKWHKFALDFNHFNGMARYNQLIYSVLEEEHGVYSSKEDLSDDLFLNLKHDGSLFDRYNRHFATWTLMKIVKEKSFSKNSDPNENAYKKIAANLISRMFQYTDNFSLKNKEMFKYLTRERTIEEDPRGISKLYVLRRWSSFTPAIPRPTAFYNRGGGFFIVHKGKGIAVDPGFDFVVNLYQEGFSVNDIDAVIITHDHIDHHADFDTLLTLWHLNQEMSADKQIKEIYLSMGLAARYNFLLNQNDTHHVYPLKEGSIVKSSAPDHAYEIEIKKAIHKDLSTDDYSVGFILKLKMIDGGVFRVGFTGDSRYNATILKEYVDCDVVLFNISSLPFREMKYYLGKTNEQENDPYKEKLIDVLFAFENTKGDTSDLPLIAKQLYYAYWYKNAGQEASTYLFSSKDCNGEYEDMELGNHLYLKGILEFNKLLSSRCCNKQMPPQLVIITELKEEIGSFRNKIADEINRYNGHPDNLKYLTGDIGMTVHLLPAKAETDPLWRIKVGCSRCKLNNDYLHNDIFHPIGQIGDFCIKGEDEGIYYLCKRHDVPKSARTKDNHGSYPPDEIFYQKIERYNVFGKA